MSDCVLPSIARMHPGDHYCGIYRTDEDHRALIVDYVREGVQRHEKMIYLVNIQSAEQLCATLVAAGIDAESLVSRGQLVIMTAKEAYLKDGEFDPDKMIALLDEETTLALEQGYAALRVTGEMTWALGGEPGTERLVEYEARLNQFFPGRKCYAMCQYDRRRFDSQMLVDIVSSHPRVLHGTEGFDNAQMYYVPPDEFLGGDRESAVLDRWLKNLSARGTEDS